MLNLSFEVHVKHITPFGPLYFDPYNPLEDEYKIDLHFCISLIKDAILNHL